MMNLPVSNPKSSLEEVREAFENWRKTRVKRSAIPEFLWHAAVALSKEHSIFAISKALRLNYTDLKRHIQNDILEPVQGAFVELDISKPGATAECMVEMIHSNGKKMRLHFKGDTRPNLAELGRIFWQS